MNDPKKAHIETYTGKIFHILDPWPDQVDIVDIAHALSNQCRFTGHTKHFYSVAEHSIYVSQLVPKEMALEGLLHDAPEAYICDMSRPLKHFTKAGEYYKEIEEIITKCLANKFGIPDKMSPEVKDADNEMLYAEKRQLMTGGPAWTEKWSANEEAADIIINCWLPFTAEMKFMDRYNELVTSGRYSTESIAPRHRLYL